MDNDITNEILKLKKIRNIKLFRKNFQRVYPYFLAGAIILGCGDAITNVLPFSSNTTNEYEFINDLIDENGDIHQIHYYTEQTALNEEIVGTMIYNEPWTIKDGIYERNIRRFDVHHNDELLKYSIDDIKYLIERNPTKALALISCGNGMAETEIMNSKPKNFENEETITLNISRINKDNKKEVLINKQKIGVVYTTEALLFILFLLSLEISRSGVINLDIKDIVNKYDEEILEKYGSHEDNKEVIRLKKKHKK